MPNAGPVLVCNLQVTAFIKRFIVLMIFVDRFIANLLLCEPVKNLKKSVNIYLM